MTFPPFVVFMMAAVRTPDRLGHEKKEETETTKKSQSMQNTNEKEEGVGSYKRMQDAKRRKGNINKRSRRVAIEKRRCIEAWLALSCDKSETNDFNCLERTVATLAISGYDTCARSSKTP